MMKLVCFIILVVSSTVLSAQPALSTKSKKAIELYTLSENYRVRGQYTQAIDLLSQAIEKDKGFSEAYFRLGQVFKSLRQYAKAQENFETGLALVKDERSKRPYWYELGEVYFAIGKYEEAVTFLNNYRQSEIPSVQNKTRFDNAKKMIESAEFAKNNQALGQLYQQRPLSDTVNCFAMQYFPVLTADQQNLIYTRRLGNSNSDDEDIVISRKDERGNWNAPVSIADEINSSLNEGTSAISADGRKLIFTSCVGRDGWGSCDLYESNKVGERWSVPKNLGAAVNSPDWESQPSLSADGRTLYFISDRRGGVGKRDIWVSTQDVKGNWIQARNLGREVNTSGDEISPFIHVNNRTLYFASNGLTGFGGYDIFYQEKQDNGSWSKAINMGGPINDHEDQFSLFVTADGTKAFYSHESVNDKGQTRSQLYETLVPENQRPKKSSSYVRGKILDKETKRPLRAKVELIDLERDTLESFTRSDSISGEYLMVLTKGAHYALHINKEKYLFKSLYFDFRADSNQQAMVIDIELEKLRSGSVTVLNNIFFEFDKYELQLASLAELDKMVRLLKENPTISIEVGGHTDNVGSEAYNLELSQKRASSVVKYLLKKEIPQYRVKSKGYGSSRPIAPNTSEKDQKLNRRIEFRVL